MNIRTRIPILIIALSMLLNAGMIAGAFSTNRGNTSVVNQFINHPVMVAQKTDKDVVYTSGTGSKYHRTGCRYIKNKKTKTTRGAARKAGYTACKVCKP